ncbi:MAG TPA: hypothetical protein PK765_05345 [bacterium]|nr:hypothetical protein [bacterium]
MTIPHLLDRLVTSGAISRDVAPKMSHALSRLSPSLTRLVEENNAAVRLAKEASGKAIPKTDDVSTSLTRMSLANQEIARARGIFEQANSAAVVANTFVEKVRTRIAPNMTPEENAKLALDLFLDSFTNGKEKTLADLQAAKKDAPKHAIYWIERTEAKFGELERVFEEEIIPLDMELKRLQKNKDVK